MPPEKNAQFSSTPLQLAKKVDAIIPFSSDIKFNAFIRNMGDHLCIFLKGAPERVLVRCNKIMIGGQEQELTQELREEVN